MIRLRAQLLGQRVWVSQATVGIEMGNPEPGLPFAMVDLRLGLSEDQYLQLMDGQAIQVCLES